MKHVIYYLFNVIHVRKKWMIVVLKNVSIFIDLPYEEQKDLRKGTHNSNKIFKKGRSEVLIYKK